MDGLVQPLHLVLAALIILIELAAEARTRLRRRVETIPGNRRTTETMTPNVRRWLKYLLAILLGNTMYFAASRHLPPPARDAAGHLGLGTLVDLWFCLFAYGLIELGGFLGSRRRPKSGDR